MLMHADYRGVDHLNSRIMGRGKCIDDAAPDTSPPPSNEAVVARGVRTKLLGQITPGCSRAQDPEDAIEDTTVVNPRNAARLFLQHGLDGNPFMIGECVARVTESGYGDRVPQQMLFSVVGYRTEFDRVSSVGSSARRIGNIQTRCRMTGAGLA